MIYGSKRIHHDYRVKMIFIYIFYNLCEIAYEYIANRPRGDVLIKGDNLSCYSKDFKAWLEVEVVKVDTDNDRVQINWVGSNNLAE